MTRNAFSILLLTFVLLFGCKSTSNPTVSKSIFSSSLENEANRDFTPNTPRVGNIAELGDDRTCGESNQILAYAKTQKYRIYICGDEKDPKRFSAIAIPEDKNSPKIVIDEKPTIAWDRSYKLRDRNFIYTIPRPSSNKQLYVPHIVFLSQTLLLENEFFLNEEVYTYLFNSKIEPNYRKTILSPNRKAGDLFLGFFPAFRKQVEVCKSTPTVEGNPFVKVEAKVEAYEIDRKKYLVELTCRQSQYNGEYQYILFTEDSLQPKAKIIPFKTLLSSEFEKMPSGELKTVSGLTQFFPEDKTLKVFYKGRDGGGCGTAAEYKLIDDRFEMQELRKQDCDRDWRSPEEFPKIYP